MKKTVFICLLMTMLMTTNSVLAGTEALATKNYVDQGLIYVYDKMVSKDTELQDEIDELKNTVDAMGDGGLTQRVKELEDNQLSAGVGVVIDTNAETDKKEINVKGLAATKTDENKEKIYVYKNGNLVELQTVKNWGEND